MNHNHGIKKIQMRIGCMFQNDSALEYDTAVESYYNHLNFMHVVIFSHRIINLHTHDNENYFFR